MKDLNSLLQFKNRSKRKYIYHIHTGSRMNVTQYFGSRVLKNLKEKIAAGFTRARIITFSKNSFSFLKKNFFNFGLESFLFVIVLCSIAINFVDSDGRFTVSKNEYLVFLQDHPAWNDLVMNKIKTENINAAPEKASLISIAQAAMLDPLDAATAPMLTDGAETPQNHLLLMSGDGALIKPSFVTKDAGQTKEISEYVVRNGDTISKIADAFGISIQTILFENKLGELDLIHPGQKLKILPTTGIKHAVAANETVGQIAKKYQVDLETVLAYNEIEVPEDIQAGEILIIPDAKFQVPATQKNNIASYNKYEYKTATVPPDFIASVGPFIWPLETHNITQYFSSKHRALDISNGQRPQFWAVNGGIVELSGWDGAYGRSVIINHGNGVKSRYGHASELYVAAGDYVAQGQVIGRVGNTGRSYGRTGNHLHLEIIKDGVKLNPLSVF